MSDREFYLLESAAFTHELIHSEDVPWPTNRDALRAHGIEVSMARVVECIEDNDWLNYMIVASADRRVFQYFVQYEPSADPCVLEWRDITGEIAGNPHVDAIEAVLATIPA